MKKWWKWKWLGLGLTAAALGLGLDSAEEKWLKVTLSLAFAIVATAMISLGIERYNNWKNDRIEKKWMQILSRQSHDDQTLSPESDWNVGFDDEIIWSKSPSGQKEEIFWTKVKAIFIETNDLGPFSSDVFWHVAGENIRITFPLGATGEKEMLSRFQKLKNFNNEEVIAAMSTTDNQVFKVWQQSE
jgi:hypothetical protein